MGKEVISAVVQLTYVPEHEPVLTASPSVIVAEGGKIPSNTYIRLRLWRDGQELTGFAIHSLFPSSTGGYGPAGTAFEDVRWAFSTAVGNIGYRILRGTVPENCVLDCAVEFEGRVYHAPVAISVSSEPEKPRDPAYTPPPMLWEDYPVGYQFQNGDTYTDASGTEHQCTRIDVVIHGTSANGLALPWRCKVSHRKGEPRTSSGGYPTPTSADSDIPHATNTATGAVASKYWQAADGGPFNLLATMVLLAKNAFIDILTSNAIRVMKSDGSNVSVKFSGGAWPIICGSDTPDNAPTKISDDGTFYSRKGIFEGSVLEKFRKVEESDATVSTVTGADTPRTAYKLNNDLNVITNVSGIRVTLPTGAAYIGYTARIADPTVAITRSDKPTEIVTDDSSVIFGHRDSSQSGSWTAGTYTVKSIRFVTGMIELIALPHSDNANKCSWFVKSANTHYLEYL